MDAGDRHAEGTLWDPRIFGPLHDWQCHCRYYVGRSYAGLVCPRCGVRIGEAGILQQLRFGHMELPRPVEHPFFPGIPMQVLPVLPVALRSSDRSLEWIDDGYLAILDATQHSDPAAAQHAVRHLYLGKSASDHSLLHVMEQAWKHHPLDAAKYAIALSIRLRLWGATNLP